MLETELSKALEAVALAANLTGKVQNELDSIVKQFKNDKSPVTVADYGAQCVIAKILFDAFPEYQMIAEESAANLKQSPELSVTVTELVASTLGSEGHKHAVDVFELLDKGKDNRNTKQWVLDPIDGTLGFLRGEQYAIALALLDSGKPVLSVMACPQFHKNGSGNGLLFYAIDGKGAFERHLNEPLEVWRQIHAATKVDTCILVESVESSHSDHLLSKKVVSTLMVPVQVLRMDSQVKYAALSRGDASLYLRFPKGDYIESTWDHAAGALLLCEAGGAVSDIRGNELDFSKGSKLPLENKGGIIAGNGRFQRLACDYFSSL